MLLFAFSTNTSVMIMLRNTGAIALCFLRLAGRELTINDNQLQM